jgi:hypothetical protein
VGMSRHPGQISAIVTALTSADYHLTLTSTPSIGTSPSLITFNRKTTGGLVPTARVVLSIETSGKPVGNGATVRVAAGLDRAGTGGAIGVRSSPTLSEPSLHRLSSVDSGGIVECEGLT